MTLTPADYAELITAAAARGDTERVQTLAQQLADAQVQVSPAGGTPHASGATTNAAGEPVIPASTINTASAEQLAGLQQNDPQLYSRSVAHAAAIPEAAA